MKKIALFTLLLISSLSSTTIETERTVLIPWTIEHTQEWEIIEQNDDAPSFYRRNTYFENMDDLLRRDTNWLRLHDHIHHLWNEKIIFPDLGFAIIRKIDDQLIGTIRMKAKDHLGVLSLSYVLRPDIRGNKFGQEIIKAITLCIDNLLETPMICFKDEKSKDEFLDAWFIQGLKENPDLPYLATFFSDAPQPLKKITASVNAHNPASIAILLHNGLQSFALGCDQYIFAHDEKTFSYDFVLQYPADATMKSEMIESLVYDFLSKDEARINNSDNFLKDLFHVPSDALYLKQSRAEKATLRPVFTITSYFDEMMTRKIIRWKQAASPYFVE